MEEDRGAETSPNNQVSQMRERGEKDENTSLFSSFLFSVLLNEALVEEVLHLRQIDWEKKS